MEKKINYFEIFSEALTERGLTIKDVEEAEILKEFSFYNFKDGTPLTYTAIEFANLVHMSLDYIVGLRTENIFKKYKTNQSNFYTRLTNLLKSMGVSKRKLADDLHFSLSNYSYWLKGNLPLFSRIVEICDYLRCNIDDLLETE